MTRTKLAWKALNPELSLETAQGLELKGKQGKMLRYLETTCPQPWVPPALSFSCTSHQWLAQAIPSLLPRPQSPPNSVGCTSSLIFSGQPSLEPQPKSSCFLISFHKSVSLHSGPLSQFIWMDLLLWMSVFPRETLCLIRVGTLTVIYLSVLNKCLWNR